MTISAGGAAGGIFVALLAPRLFRGFWEFHVGLFVSGALAIVALAPARMEITPGDARLSLERELSSRAAPGYDVLAVDAFTSDAIPVHLLTREAIATDLGRLAPGGILAIHISNRQLDLEPVVRAAASSFSLPICVVDRNERSEAVWATTWVLLSRDPAVLAVPDIARACAHREESPQVRLWTDDYSSLFRIIK